MSKRVLIAEDTAYMREMMKRIFNEMGLQVVGEAATGSTVLSQYNQLQPDLLVLNLVMPKMKGIDMLEQVKTLDPNATVLVCSAMGQAPTIFEAIRSGATEFVVKPFSRKRMIEGVCRALGIEKPVS